MTQFVNNDVSSGAVVYASDHNTQGSLVAAVVNGGLENENIKAGAAIDGSKLASNSVTASQINFGSGGSGLWWEEVARTTLSGTADSISVASIPARKYLRIIVNLLNSGSIDGSITFNNDTAANYNRRYSENGGADSTNTSVTSVGIVGAATGASLIIVEVINISAREKVFYWRTTGQTATGAANLNNRREGSGKWANTSAQINRVDVTNGGAGDYAAGSEIIVLGHD